ncbi:hypothetical protein [Shewanella algae]|uniref:hypothetical protein n=1 Tax=Shewanella algae TaxID=38313 RepID=UPI0031F48441
MADIRLKSYSLAAIKNSIFAVGVCQKSNNCLQYRGGSCRLIVRFAAFMGYQTYPDESRILQ